MSIIEGHIIWNETKPACCIGDRPFVINKLVRPIILISFWQVASLSRIVVSEAMDAVGLTLLQDQAEVYYDPLLWQEERLLKAWISEADALVVRNQTQVTRSLLQDVRHLKVIGRLGVGLDNIDLQAARAHGIPVVAARGANAIAVAEYVFACLFHACRRLTTLDAGVRTGQWDRRLGGSELYGKILGLIGLGDIGQRVAVRARALGLRVMAYDPWQLPTHWAIMDYGVRLTDMGTVLKSADFVSVHVPLTPQTRALINGSALSAMKPGAYLINTARGGIVEEPALLDAVKSGHLAGAFLDVRSVEPPARPDPMDDEPRIILTPHISGLTQEAGIRTARMVALDVLRVLGGEPPVASV